jgi:hypothetical protein
MSDPITIGAGVGAGISMISGKNPLKGAALGGLGGAGYGALTGSGMAGNLLKQGGLFGGATAGAGTSIIPGSIESSGMVLNPATGTYMNPDYFTNVLGNQVYTGAGGVGSKIMTGAQTVGENISTGVSQFAKDNPYATQAATNVALQNMLQPTQRYQLNAQTGPDIIPSQQSQQNYVPTNLMTEVQRNQVPGFKQLYTY